MANAAERIGKGRRPARWATSASRPMLRTLPARKRSSSRSDSDWEKYAGTTPPSKPTSVPRGSLASLDPVRL